MDYRCCEGRIELLWIFAKIKIRCRYLNFTGQILTTVEMHFFPTPYFDLILMGLKQNDFRLLVLIVNFY